MAEGRYQIIRDDKRKIDIPIVRLSNVQWEETRKGLLYPYLYGEGENLFHIGILGIFVGHFFGMLTPHWMYEAWLPIEVKQKMAMFAGGASGVLCLIGGVLLLKRRLFSPRVRATTTGADILILSLLVIQCALGLLTIPFSAQHMDGSEMMKLVGWAQSVVTFHGGASQHLDGVAFIFRLHLVLGMTLFLLFPFSRLVHIWSVPVEYLTRKYQLVRARH